MRGLHNVTTEREISILKKFIAGAESSIATSGKRWCLAILISGVPDLFIYFKKETDCKAMKLEILKWLGVK